MEPTKYEIIVNDPKSVRKIQRVVIILDRIAGMLDKHKHIQIDITVIPIKKRWYYFWR